MTKVNLKMLSEKLNVSVSTVSKALRNSYEIGNETKRRVVDMAQQMGYRRNPYAGFLRNQRSKTIAIIVPELANNFFIQAICGAEIVAHEKDHHVLIYITHDDCGKEESILQDLQNGRVDGVIISLSGTTKTYSHITELISANIPVVFFDRICHEIETAKVTTDDFTSGFSATEHLIKNGCRDIAFLSLSENLSIDNKRAQGYQEALNKHNIPVSNVRIIKCSNDEKSNYTKIKQLLKSNRKPDGLFSSVEKLAITSYIVCKDLNLKIPNDIKIISFSNLRTAPLLDPPLTSIVQPAFEMGRQAATMLFKHLGKKAIFLSNENIVLKSVLVKRDSTNNNNDNKKKRKLL